MSTRACYTFKDSSGSYHVYKHCDGYPKGAANSIMAALPFAWSLPRYEADEFAAAFVCANKIPYWLDRPLQKFMETLFKMVRPSGPSTGKDLKTEIKVDVPSYHLGDDPMKGGGIRLLKSGNIKRVAPCDIEYRYEIFPTKKNGLNCGQLMVKAFSTSYWNAEKVEQLLFECTIEKLVETAIAYENKEDEAEKIAA